MNPTITELEERIAGLRAELEQTNAQLPAVEAQLELAEARLATAQRAYDETGGLWARAQQDAGSGVFNVAGASQLRERRPGDMEKASAIARDAEAVFLAARDALQESLVNRNGLNVRRGNLRAHCRYLEGQLEMTTRDLDRARAAAERQAAEQHGLLERVRASLGVS